eukprot:CFRG3154T1
MILREDLIKFSRGESTSSSTQVHSGVDFNEIDPEAVQSIRRGSKLLASDDDAFNFSCTGCGDCCRTYSHNILLDPHDIFLMSRSSLINSPPVVTVNRDANMNPSRDTNVKRSTKKLGKKIKGKKSTKTSIASDLHVWKTRQLMREWGKAFERRLGVFAEAGGVVPLLYLRPRDASVSATLNGGKRSLLERTHTPTETLRVTHKPGSNNNYKRSHVPNVEGMEENVATISHSMSTSRSTFESSSSASEVHPTNTTNANIYTHMMQTDNNDTRTDNRENVDDLDGICHFAVQEGTVNRSWRCSLGANHMPSSCALYPLGEFAVIGDTSTTGSPYENESEGIGTPRIKKKNTSSKTLKHKQSFYTIDAQHCEGVRAVGESVNMHENTNTNMQTTSTLSDYLNRNDIRSRRKEWDWFRNTIVHFAEMDEVFVSAVLSPVVDLCKLNKPTYTYINNAQQTDSNGKDSECDVYDEDVSTAHLEALEDLMGQFQGVVQNVLVNSWYDFDSYVLCVHDVQNSDSSDLKHAGVGPDVSRSAMEQEWKIVRDKVIARSDAIFHILRDGVDMLENLREQHALAYVEKRNKKNSALRMAAQPPLSNTFPNSNTNNSGKGKKRKRKKGRGPSPIEPPQVLSTTYLPIESVISELDNIIDRLSAL